MAFPVINTFIEFRVTKHARRTRSSPPEFQIHIALAEASCRRPRKKHRRRRAPPEDEQALSEYRQQARLEKCVLLATQVVVKHRKETRRQTRVIMATYRAALRIPTLREALPTRVFLNVANCLGIYHVAFTKFVCQGVLRPNADNMEIWLSQDDLMSGDMKTLVLRAKEFRLCFSRGEFVLRLPVGAKSVCTSTMRLDEHMTVDGLKGIAAASSGIQKDKIRMTHLGTELVRGKLVDCYVSPGSCIIASELIEC